ncbi:39S ribosomal protein L52, mitochondrial [Aphidius gifuensis]|uniref:39S ribosomal protein L52, mitochondrial n=1 Tax=Aphidius gifuensis TaxID=684658 RepID=UPI001CDC95C1|nr:39S ribosomal protein L52, mitochondrial [Aphidius gifuensis]
MAFVEKITSLIRARSVYSIVKGIHTTCVIQIDQKWRRENRLPKNPNKFGALTNLPDYSFVDGKPVPFGIRQYQRIQKQREYLEKIQKLTSEVDYAVLRHAKMQEKIMENRQKIISSKFKPKGQQLINESTSQSDQN